MIFSLDFIQTKRIWCEHMYANCFSDIYKILYDRRIDNYQIKNLKPCTNSQSGFYYIWFIQNAGKKSYEFDTKLLNAPPIVLYWT